MKKYFVFAAMALATFMNYSCSEVDKPGSPTTDVYYLDGKDYVANVVATFQGEVGTEVSLGLGVYDPFDVYAVDFGDGNLVIDSVGWHGGGVREGEGEVPAEKPGTTHTGITTFKGTIAGKGIVTVYGNSDLWYASLSGGIAPTSFDQQGLKKVVQFNISGANMEKVELPQLEELTQFSFNNSPVKSVDVSKAPNLTSLTIGNLATSEFDSQLTSIDVSQNTKLESISIAGGVWYNIAVANFNNKPGKLTKLDLSKNPAIKTIAVSNNKLTEIILPEDAAIDQLSIDYNELTSIDLSKIKSIKNIQAGNNKFKSLDLSKLVAKGTIRVNDNELTALDIPVDVAHLYAQNNKIAAFSMKELTNSTPNLQLQNNELTIATLPVKSVKMTTASKLKKYIYSPQADMEVTPAGAVVDLSAQAKAKGILAEEVATTFKITAGNAVLVEGTDYNIADGKITFLKSVNEALVTMTTTAFPNLTLSTKPFNVTVAAE